MDAANNLPAEVPHPARSGCTLRLVLHRHVDAAINFQCDGCREPGEGTRYTSVTVNHQPRNLVLHTHCALATPTLQHPLVRGTMELRHVAPTGGDAVVCDACYGAVQGFHYHCSKKTKKGEYLDLHPGCAKMPVSITLQDGTTFELRMEVSHRCSSCSQMEWYYRPWCYCSTNLDQRVYLHVKCIREITACSSSSSGAGAGDDKSVIALLRERAGGRSRLVTRVCEVLLILMRVVIGVLFGDPTALLVAGVNLMPALLNQ